MNNILIRCAAPIVWTRLLNDWFPVNKRTVRWEVSLVTRKPLFGVSDQIRLKPACSATEAS